MQVFCYTFILVLRFSFPCVTVNHYCYNITTTSNFLYSRFGQELWKVFLQSGWLFCCHPNNINGLKDLCTISKYCTLKYLTSCAVSSLVFAFLCALYGRYRSHRILICMWHLGGALRTSTSSGQWQSADGSNFLQDAGSAYTTSVFMFFFRIATSLLQELVWCIKSLTVMIE